MSDSATEAGTVLIIGYGNPLRRDDGVGWSVATELADRFEAIAVHQLLPELAAKVSRFARVVFIDAENGSPAGSVRTRDVRPARSDHSVMAHQLGPAQLLALSRREFGRWPAARLITVAGEDFGYGEQLSARVREARDRVVAQLTKTLVEQTRCTSCP